MGIRRIGAATAVVAVALTVGAPTIQAQTNTLDRVIIVGTRTSPCCGFRMSFDNFMTSFFGSSPYGDTGFDAPESEAYSTVFMSWIKGWFKPTPALTMDSCSMEKDGGARDISAFSSAEERRLAAQGLFFQNLPNFINRNKDGLIFAVIFGDGTQEAYRHTTFYGVQAVANTLVKGDGIKRC
jgi:hypothetical protein